MESDEKKYPFLGFWLPQIILPTAVLIVMILTPFVEKWNQEPPAPPANLSPVDTTPRLTVNPDGTLRLAEQPWWPDMTPYWPYVPVVLMFLLVTANALLAWRNSRNTSLVGDGAHALLGMRAREVEELQANVSRLTNERDGAIEAYERCSRNFTMERFRNWAAKFPNMKVKVRCAGYNADWALVEKIKELFEKEAQWKVEIDPNNSPPLMPNDKYKVVVRTVEPDRIVRLQSFLHVEDGRLLDQKVAMTKKAADPDVDRVVIEVLPTVGK